MTLERPAKDEYDSYYGLYIDQAPDGEVLDGMSREAERTRELLADVSGAAETYRYAEGKWSLREVVGHLIDTEWTFAYRGLCFAREDPAHLPGFDQDHWARISNAEEIPLPRLLETFVRARQSSVAIFRTFDDRTWLRRGIANGLEFSVRAMPYILWGHELHHRKVLERLYLQGSASEPEASGLRDLGPVEAA